MNNPKNLIFNQSEVEPQKFRYTPSGLKKARLIHILSKSCCPKCYEDLENVYTDRMEVWLRLPIL